MDRKIYLDNASTTYVSSEVLNEMMPCFNALYGNAGSLHSFGRSAMAIIDKARDRIKEGINAAKATEIYFTSGGTEADNMAILGVAHAYSNKGKHIITSQIEHRTWFHRLQAFLWQLRPLLVPPPSRQPSPSSPYPGRSGRARMGTGSSTPRCTGFA